MPSVNLDFLNNFRKVGVLGLGRTGTTAYSFFRKYNIDAVFWDDSEESREKFVKSCPNGSVVPYIDWQDCSHIIVSPGIPLLYPKKHPIMEVIEKNNIQVTSDNEILYSLKKNHAKFVAITGTNGKSTITSMIGHVLKHNGCNVTVGGNIGISAFDLPLHCDIYVLELSSFQLDLLHDVHFDIAVLPNITPDHLDRHGTMANYIEAKSKIFKHQTTEDFIVLGIDNPITSWIYEEQKSQKLSSVIGVSGTSSFLSNSGVISFNNNRISDNFWFEEYDVAASNILQGKQNRENFAACYASCRALGLKPYDIIRAISNFVGLSHRMEYLGSINNVGFYNDSKATNADATKPALESLDNIYWLAGGIAKDGGISSILGNMHYVKKAYLFGEAARIFASQLANTIPHTLCDNMQTALKMAYEDATKEGIKANILLSPACASFDQFTNFEDRGEKFKELYNNLKIASDAAQ